MLDSKNNLKTFFNPRSIAIVGVTEKEGKVGNVVAKNILNIGYGGEVFLVNPKHKELFGRRCYSSLEEINEKVDLAIIIIPAKFVNNTIKNAADKVKNFAIISAGFSEMGEKGKKRENELAKLAEKNNLNILGPNCLGFINPKIKLNASFAGGMPEMGNIALISQSGALAVGFMDAAEKEGIKFSNLISIGNKARINETDLIKYFSGDESTKAIAVYIEGIKNGREFMKITEKVSAKKPIIILKAGKTEKARKAIVSHTGALAGSSEIINAVFEKAGILRADNLENFFDLIKLASNSSISKNKEAIIITNAGGPGVLTADAFGGKEIKLAKIGDKTKKELKSFLPDESSVENPIDLLGDAQEDRYKKTLKIASQENAGMIICVLTPQDQTPCEKIAHEIIDFKNKTGKTTITVFIGGKKIIKALDILRENNIPNFSFPEKAVKVLDKYYKWSACDASALIQKEKINKERQEKTLDIIEKAKAENRDALLFSEAKEIMDLYGISVVKAVNLDSRRSLSAGLADGNDIEGTENSIDKEKNGIIANENDMEVKFPVAVKVDSDKILHKTDRQGVILNIKNQEELKVAIGKMEDSFPGENIIIQPMLEIQTELILGIKKDAVFGPIIVCGLGGIYTEIFKTVEFFIPPMNTEKIKKRLAKSKLGFLFKETRGQKSYNIENLAGIILKLAQLAIEIREIKEFDINPLLIYNNGKETKAVDIKIII
ncbi:acetate--CoA ligase family protein [bacterium]|nr:acetate--CoA ligase family protein [bacterium]